MITITCYDKTETHPEKDRRKLMKFYMEGVMCCDGSEKDRYMSIYCGLDEGHDVVDDQWNWS